MLKRIEQSTCRSRAPVIALVAGILSLGCGVNAQALTIDPDTTPIFSSGPETSQAAIDTILLGLIGTSTEDYKENIGDGFDSGSLAGSYETVFANDPLDPEEATITYVGGPIVLPTAYLLVKDGAQDPGWYLFDLTSLGWDGMETLDLINFWPDQGAISHIALYGDLLPPPPPPRIETPEPTTLTILGLGLAGLGVARRKKRA